MDNRLNSQEPASPASRVFVTIGTSGGANVTNVAGNQNITFINTHRSILFPDFVVPDAGYQGSGSRKSCLEGTRKAIIKKILNWKGDVDASSLCWLSGPAGFGKSAISQTIAELSAQDRTLIASFFFLRGAGGRSEFTHFIATLAFQITASVPAAKPIIEEALQNDPTIFHQRIAIQLQKLVLSPLASLPASHFPTQPLIIVIDGLDECNDKRAVQDFIDALASAGTSRAPELRWLLTSRREDHIQQAFLDDAVQAISALVALEDFNADGDIETFLKYRFSVIRQRNPRLFHDTPLPWPSLEDLEALVRMACGMFLFVATLVDFIADGNAAPQKKLQNVLIGHAGLDPLYDQVLRAVPEMACFRRVLATLMLLHTQPSVTTLAYLLRLDTLDVLRALISIQSILRIPENNSTRIELNHTSLRDFLMDRSRSKDLFVDPPAVHFSIAADCVRAMNRTLTWGTFPLDAVPLYAIKFWRGHLKDSAVAGNSNAFPELVRDLKEFLSSDAIEGWINVLIYRNTFQETIQELLALIAEYMVLEGGMGLAGVLAEVKERLEADIKAGSYGNMRREQVCHLSAS